MDNKRIRLDKYISSQCVKLSRSDVKKLVRDGRVAVNGSAVRSCETKVTAGADTVTLDGEEIGFKAHIYIMLNKPQGYVCSAREGSSPTVYELIPEDMRRKGLFPAGRLDKDTEGFVLMTDDGELAHNMLAPSRHVPKTYFVRLRDRYKSEYEKMFADGITIDGGEKCLPAEVFPDENDEYCCTLILHEGKFHQVKRMFLAAGNKVEFLKRVCIGKLPLDDSLAVGECLEIMHKDVEKLLHQ